uniref:Uncharacterized protein n=1 Tax=Anopheles quadriannulatus TaxID=34691 RepID=A0A182XR16_ANOQN
MRKQRQQREGS